MRLQLAALIATFVIAIVAAVFAIWPAVGDAPWEDDAPVVQPVDRTREIRCEGALSFRDSVTQAGRVGLGGRGFDEELAKAEGEISRYCGADTGGLEGLAEELGGELRQPSEDFGAGVLPTRVR